MKLSKRSFLKALFGSVAVAGTAKAAWPDPMRDEDWDDDPGNDTIFEPVEPKPWPDPDRDEDWQDVSDDDEDSLRSSRWSDIGTINDWVNLDQPVSYSAIRRK